MTEEYFKNPDLWVNGSVSLKDIIDDIMIISQSQDSLFKNVSRFQLSLIARAGLRDLKHSYKNSVRGVQFTVSSNLTMPYPEDYDSFIRASIVDSCGKLTEIYRKASVPSYVAVYLQNCNGELVFDCKGEIYDIGSTLKCRHGHCIKDKTCKECTPCTITCIEEKKDWISEQGGYFSFDPQLEDKDVFIEYASNGIEKVDDCGIRIKYGYKEALTNYIKWQYLINQRNTQNQAVYFQNQYFLEKKKISLNGIDTDPISLNRLVQLADMRFK